MRLTFLFFLLSLCARAEFPPDTFPPDGSPPPSNNAPGSYEENESRAAEDEYLAPRRRRAAPPPAVPAKRRAPRDGVSRQALPDDEDREYAREAPRKPGAFQRQFRLSGLLGYHVFSSSDSTSDTEAARIYVKDHFALGGGIDFRFLKHFGVDVEAFYAFTPNQEFETSTPGTFGTMQLAELSAMAGLRAEWPLQAKEWTWRPRVMLGYGIANSAQITGTIAAGATGMKSLQVTGIYIGAGVEGDLGQDIHLLADYSMSINSSAYRTETGVGAGTTGPAGGSGLTRLRVAGSIRVWGPMSLGAQFVLRSQSSDVPADVAGGRLIGGTQNYLQILATSSVVF